MRAGAGDACDPRGPLRRCAGGGPDRLDRIGHIVVIYEENHSFDNLYGRWERVDGLSQADAAHTTQVSQASELRAK
jgi:phospholipase C